MIEMPLPRPRSVICSPSHIRNIVPVVRFTTVVSRKPTGSMTSRLNFERHRDAERLEQRQNQRAVTRVLRDLALAASPFLLQRFQCGDHDRSATA